jgi:hypothetical protein
MVKSIERMPLSAVSPGASRHLVIYRYGRPGARPKAYLQAGLHADETPPMLVLHHLVRLLDEAERVGAIRGEIVVLPACNPIGLDQEILGVHVGRSDLAGGGNFNRQWPDVSGPVAEAIGPALGEDADANAMLIRGALVEAVARIEAASELAVLRLALLRHAIDADIVLDLHCDQEALPYLYMSTLNWPAGADLAADLSMRAVLLALDPGGQAFEDVCAMTWHRLGERFGPEQPIPQGCFAATVELRGKADVSDGMAAGDAEGLRRFLMRRGVLSGDAGAMPRAVCDAVPFEAVDVIRAPAGGVLVYRAELGQRLYAGAAIAEIVDPAADDPCAARTEIVTRTDGWVLTRRSDRYVRRGQVIAKVVGHSPLPDGTGPLLED